MRRHSVIVNLRALAGRRYSRAGASRPERSIFLQRLLLAAAQQPGDDGNGERDETKEKEVGGGGSRRTPSLLAPPVYAQACSVRQRYIP